MWATVVPLDHLGEAAYADSPASVTYYHPDHLGSSIVTSSTFSSPPPPPQYVLYRPYGGVVAPTVGGSTAAPQFGFTGQRFEASVGIYDYGARWHDPALGRFLQPDSTVPSPTDTQSLNRYSYVRNNPVERIDPTGNSDLSSAWNNVTGFLNSYIYQPMVETFFNYQWTPENVNASLQSANFMEQAGPTFAIGLAGLHEFDQRYHSEVDAANVFLATQVEIGGPLEAGALLAIREDLATSTLASEVEASLALDLDGGSGLAATAGAADAFEYYIRAARTLDVSTAENGAVFWSGPGNRALAQQFAIANGRTTIEMTPGGAWLDAQHLFGPDSPLTTSGVDPVPWTVGGFRAQGLPGPGLHPMTPSNLCAGFGGGAYTILVSCPPQYRSFSSRL